MRLDSQTAIEQFFNSASFASDAGRASALENFFAQGLPHRRVEDWKYTSVRALAEKDFTFDKPVQQNPIETPDFSDFKIVFHNGVCQNLPKQTELEVTEFSNAVMQIDKNNHPFAHLNQALSQTGLKIRIPQNTELSQPIHIVFAQTATNQAILPRIVIELEANATATIVEHYLGESKTENFVNTVSEVNLADNAELNHYLIQEDSLQSFAVHGLHAIQHKNSRLNTWVTSLGGRLVRNDVDIQFVGEGASTVMNGLYLPNQNQHFDNHTFAHHDVSHCQSSEYYKGIIGENARAVFNGKVLVKENTIQTVANQMNKNLLLAENSEVDTKPELEIYADDVICSHGATVGQLDDEALFYFRARGICERDAKALLMNGFAGELIESIELNLVKDYLLHQVEAKLEQMSSEK